MDGGDGMECKPLIIVIIGKDGVGEDEMPG